MYSISITVTLFLITSVLLLYSNYKDKKDNITKQYLHSPNYDLLQNYLITYNKQKIDKNYSVFILFKYMIKVS